MTYTLATGSPEETRAFAQRLGALLQPGDVLVLAGEMGAGKTAFTKGVALALGIEEQVASPTFTIVREYAASIPLVHVDASERTQAHAPRRVRGLLGCARAARRVRDRAAL